MVRSIAFISLAALALAGCDSGAQPAAQESAATSGENAAPPQLPGQMVRAFAGTELPALKFNDPEGNTLDLGELDQPVLVNLWATWCVPCVVEMPALDQLAAEMEGEVRVLTISQDNRGADVVVPFFESRNFRHLEQWLDPQNDLAVEFSDGGLLPVTVLFDADGKEVLRVAGGYEWDSEEAIAQVKEAISQ
ncbi:TlpA family protein disulfide reductase [Erythrobacter sp. SCSIO 43205]|uniref:TlpA family protein disulfide reductase n=1 Tax=Erythrobacter sp. SCSIO 43205 TaxID=2779361 RepID=UPI001CA90326|nr:TlpA disulfide reductase family protein [Erythrobacter sp. SCSIO 43205]UAB79394.1 TlpA family protein disulfide reductase [Erythrobacter sp. SCSIO 43205]